MPRLKINISEKSKKDYFLMSKNQKEEFLRFAALGITDISAVKMDNFLLESANYFETPHHEFAYFMSKPENFWFTCKWLFNIDLHPFQVVILQELWKRKFPMLIGCRGMGKTFILALYAFLRAVFTPNSKIVVVGAAFRQSRLIFEYIENFYRNSPVLQSICEDKPRRDIDRCFFNVNKSLITAIPIGTGEKIRGLRANYIIADEFASITPEIYEVVIKGFGSVSSNPTKKAEKIGKINILKQLGEYEQAQNIEDTIGMGNQSIVSGTAYYAFNHFYSYWKRYKSIIKSGGDEKYLRDTIFQSSEIPDGFNWKDYSVMRIPYTILPPGFMDDANIASSRANVHKAIYLMEYEGIFAEDSDGFFKRSLIESCVAHSEKPVVVSDGSEVTYNAGLHGDPNGVYIYGIDPASERDNLALVILQILPTHRRIVYCWTFNKLKLRKRLEGREHKTGYYNYCARHIRNLLKVFPSKHIGVDSQGGGIQLIESLHNPSDMLEGEQPIWPYIKEKNTLTPDPFWWESDDKPTDGEKGLHIIHSINFVNAEFTSQSNHGLRKDFEDKRVLFPAYNTVVLAEAQGLDQLYNREIDKNDTLEDVVIDIEELKDELATIEHSQTNNQGRDKWDTPEVKKPGGKVGRLRKDRYSALLIANMIARTIELKLKGQEYYFAGGAFAGQEPSFKQRNNGLYIGPDYLVKNAPPQHSYKGVTRGSSF